MRRLAVIFAAVALVSGCTGGKDDPAATASAPIAPERPIAFTVSADQVAGVRPPAPAFPDDVRTKVTTTLDRYLADAVAGPLRSAQAAGDLGPMFTGPALARVNGPDRAALVDEGLPRADDLRADTATARLAGLADDGGGLAVVTAAVDLRLDTGGSDAVTIVRTGDLVLVPDGDGWKIDGYEIRTERSSAGGLTTTTARG